MATTTIAQNIEGEKSALAEEIKAVQAIRAEATKGEGGILEVSPDVGKRYNELLASVRERKSLIDNMAGFEAAEKFLASPTRESAAVNAPTPAEFKSLGAAFLESAEFKSMRDSRSRKMDQPFEVKGDIFSYLERKDLYSALPTGTPGTFGSVQRDAPVDRARRGSRVRDLFPVQRTSAAVIEYFRVTGFTSSAAPVAERDGSDFALKPQSTMTWAGAQATVRTVAHWEAAHRNVLDDEPQLQGILETELLYGLQLEEDDQLLNGDGTGENLTGILQVGDINSITQAQGDSASSDNKADVIRRAMTTNELAYYPSTGVVMHPRDWEDIELTKSANDQVYLFNSAPSLSLQSPTIWGVPVVTTPAITEGTALVGAFGLGAQLYDREQSTVRITDSHSDFFIRNAIVILAEQRLALACKRPESFTQVTFA